MLGAESPTESADTTDSGTFDEFAASGSLDDTATTGSLPFTGLPLWIAALIGGILIASGIAVRRNN